MKKQLNNKGRGFTIIEVVLVLAIAALIFLLVFLAFPALQRNQRDTQRRNDVGRFVSQMAQYQSDNGGNIVKAPALDDFVDSYLISGKDAWQDPTGKGTDSYDSGTGYTVKANLGSDQGISDLTSHVGWMAYDVSSVCGSTGKIKSAGTRNFTIRIKLEAGGVFCKDNS